MKKLFILISVILLSTASFCQEPLSQKQPQNNISPGTYLIKAKKKMLIGFGCEFLAGGAVILGSTQYSVKFVDRGATYHPQYIMEENGKEQRNLLYTGAGVLAVTGLALQISGLGDMGKAGLSLNENGIGIKVKF